MSAGFRLNFETRRVESDNQVHFDCIKMQVTKHESEEKPLLSRQHFENLDLRVEKTRKVYFFL